MNTKIYRFVVSFTFYGISMNVGKFGGNVHLAYPLIVLMELLGYCMLFGMDRIGHKRMLIGAHVTTGISCLIAMFVVMFAEECKWKLYSIIVYFVSIIINNIDNHLVLLPY